MIERVECVTHNVKQLVLNLATRKNKNNVNIVFVQFSFSFNNHLNTTTVISTTDSSNIGCMSVIYVCTVIVIKT